MFERIKDPIRRRYISKVFELIKEKFGDKLISFVIYGSVARGQDNPNSDIDILLIIDTKLSFSERCSILADILIKLYSEEAKQLIEKGYNPSIEFYPLNVEEAKTFRMIYLDMIHDAIILYDKNNFFKSILEKVSRTLSKLGSKRVWLNEKEWYWILKPDIKFGERIEYEF